MPVIIADEAIFLIPKITKDFLIQLTILAGKNSVLLTSVQEWLLSCLLHIFFDSYSVNTLNINVNVKHTLFVATEHMQFTTHYFDFESKKIVRKQVQIKRTAKDKLKMR